MRPLQVAKQMGDQVSGIGPDPSEGGRGEVALFGQADEVQTGHLAGPPIALHHLAGFVLVAARTFDDVAVLQARLVAREEAVETLFRHFLEILALDP